MSKFSDIIGRDSLTLVDFYADWCGPCKTMAPVLDQLKAHYGDRLTVLKINIDNNPKAAAAYQIQSVPTLLMFKSGQIVWRQSGAMPLGALKQAVDSKL